MHRPPLGSSAAKPEKGHHMLCVHLRKPQPLIKRRRGVASVLAMLFLILFSVLAVAFYASTALSAQLASNDQRIQSASFAAESGMAFMRYQLAQVVVPAGTPQNQLLSAVAAGLSSEMNGSGNLQGSSVGYVPGGSSINVPAAASQLILLDSAGAGFRADLSQSGDLIVVKVTGREATHKISRAVQLNFKVAEVPSGIFDYGMATKGALTLSGGILKGVPDATRGSFLSTTMSTGTPLSMSGSAVVSGQVYFTNPSGAVSGSGSIAGTTNTSQWGQYVHPGTPAPEFPAVDPTPYVNYMNSTTMTIISASTSATPLSNIRIKAGTNPTFSGGGTINGLIYIEAPNKVTFSGGTHVNGVIVVDNPNDTTSTNAIIFSGGGIVQGPETLPSSYGALTGMTGVAVLAPNFGLTLTGGSATFGGNILAKSVALSGGSGGSINGSVIAYGTASTTFSGGSGFTFTSTGPTNVSSSSGVHFSGRLAPIADSYTEPSR
jgi:hypothetical protein